MNSLESAASEPKPELWRVSPLASLTRMPPNAPKVLSRTIETLAEEAMHEAFAIALDRWPQTGIPDQPRPWLISTARFKAVDGIRRRPRFDGVERDLALHMEARMNDDHLRASGHFGGGEALQPVETAARHWRNSAGHASTARLKWPMIVERRSLVVRRMGASRLSIIEAAEPKGAFGNTLASYYHLSASETATLSWSKQSTFAITRLRSDDGMPATSESIPEENAIHVAVAIKPVPLKSFELSFDNREIATPYIPPFHTNVLDLQSKTVCFVDCGFDYVHYHVPREGLDEIARDHNVRPVDNYKLVIGQDDLVIAQMTKNVLPYIGSQNWPSSLALDQFSLVFGAHLLQKYGGLSRLPAVAYRGLAPWQKRRAAELLAEHLDGNIHLGTVAQECCMSVSHFARSFKVSFGVSAHRWLIARRIDRAKDLLSKTSLPLIDVALQSGFSDQAAFTRTFRQMAGDSPGHWRRENSVR